MLESEDPAQHSRDFELASVHDRRVRLLKQCAEGSSAEAQAQIECLRLLAAHTYLALQLGIGARPIAERALAARVGKGVQSPQDALLLIRDKDSQAYREVRVLPVANALGKALDQLNAAVHAVMGHTGAGGSYFQPESLASLDMGAVKDALADVLHRAGFRLI